MENSSKCSVYMIAVAHLCLFIGLTMLSLGATLSKIASTISTIAGFLSVLVIILIPPECSWLKKIADGLCFILRNNDAQKKSFLSASSASISSQTTPMSSNVEIYNNYAPLSNSQEVPILSAPRWERRWAKTEAKRIKKKESKFKKVEAFRRESTSLEQRERQRRADEAMKRTKEQQESRSIKEQLKADRRLAAQAVETAMRTAEAERKVKIDEERLRVKQKRAEKRRADLLAKRLELEAERRHKALSRLDAAQAAVSAALALSVAANTAHSTLLAALDAVAEAPQKRRSHKSKALARKSRHKASDSRIRAEAADRIAREAATHARDVWLGSGQPLHTFPAELEVRLQMPITMYDENEFDDCLDGDTTSLGTGSRDDEAEASLKDAVILETPAEIRRLIEQVRTTHAKHLSTSKQKPSAPVSNCTIEKSAMKTYTFEDERDPHLRCQ